MKGGICNIPISERYNNCNLLSMFADTNGVIIVKLKRKVGHRGYVIFEPLGPTIIESFLNSLRLNNHLYRYIEINMKNLRKWSLNLQKNIWKKIFTIIKLANEFCVHVWYHYNNHSM